MKTLCYQTLDVSGYRTPKASAMREKVLQFGEGNFLRAFVDWMIHLAVEQGVYQGSVVVCQPIAQGMGHIINKQEGLYTLAMRGIEDGKATEKYKLVSSVSRCINPYEDYDALLQVAASPDLQVVVSNTTEAGIAYGEGDKVTDTPPKSFPAKVCALLYHRFLAFQGDPKRGLLFLPVELIDDNGAKLRQIVLRYCDEWALGADFKHWVEEHNHFCSTLVDRIVTGYPRDEAEGYWQKLGYEDQALVTSELFNLWVIEGKQEWSDLLPIHKAEGANVIWTEDVTPYKKRKVRILNGAHTSSVLAAWLAGHNIVLEMMTDSVFDQYLDQIMYKEVIPTLDLSKEMLIEFADAVKARFLNPYIKHRLLDISLNSCSKWCARCMPSLLEYYTRVGKIPKGMAFSLAVLIQFYKGSMEDGKYMSKRADGTIYQIRDDQWILDFFCQTWACKDCKQVAERVLSHTELWNETDLTKVEGLQDMVTYYLFQMNSKPMKEVILADVLGK